MLERNRSGKANRSAAKHYGVLSGNILFLATGDHPSAGSTATDGKRLNQTCQLIGDTLIHSIEGVIPLCIWNENVFREAADGSGSFCVSLGIARVWIDPFAYGKICDILSELYNARNSFMTKLPANCNLVTRVWPVFGPWVKTATSVPQILE